MDNTHRSLSDFVVEMLSNFDIDSCYKKDEGLDEMCVLKKFDKLYQRYSSKEFIKKYGDGRKFPDWNENEIKSILESNLFVSKPSLIISLIISLLIKISGKNGFRFDDNFRERLYNKFAVLPGESSDFGKFFLIRNSKNIFLDNWRMTPEWCAFGMQSGSININNINKIGALFATDMQNGTININNADEIGFGFVMDMRDGIININSTNKIKDAFGDRMQNGIINIKSCNIIDGSFGNEIKNGRINVDECLKLMSNPGPGKNITGNGKVKIKLRIYSYIVPLEIYRSIGPIVFYPRVNINDILKKDTENFYYEFVKKFHKFFKTLHPKLQTSDVPPLEIKHIRVAAQYNMHEHDIELNLSRSESWESSLAHEYVHHLAITVFKNSLIMHPDLIRNVRLNPNIKRFIETVEDININSPYRKYSGTRDNIIKLVEGITDFLTELYCIENGLVRSSDYNELKDKVGNVFIEKAVKDKGWMVFGKDAIKEFNNTKFWSEFFDEVLGGEAEELKEIENAVEKLSK